MVEFNPSVIIFSFIIVLWCYNKWTNRHFNRLAAKLKGPPTYPFIGSILEIIGTTKQFMDKVTKISKEYGMEPIKIWLGPFFVVNITKPEDIQIILNNSKALKKPRIYNFIKTFLGDGLIAAPVEKWRKHRRIIAPAFNMKIIEQFFSIFNEKNEILVRNLMKELNNTIPFDLFEYICPTSIDIICETAMGYNLNTQIDGGTDFRNAIFRSQELFIMRVMRPWLYPNLFYSVYERLSGKYKIAQTLHKLPTQVIKEKKQSFTCSKTANQVINVNDDDNKDSKIFLDALLELSYGCADFSDIELRDEVVTMMVAGSESTAITSSFCLLMLAIHQDVQDKVYNEIYHELGDKNETISMDSASKLMYLEQVLMETLRLFPFGILILRELEDDVKIFSGDYVLPKGTTVCICSYGTHRRPELYLNPTEFNPENFSKENIAKRHKYSYIPFSGGARGCIGSKYAMMSMKVIVSKILQNYSVHTNIKVRDIKLEFDATLRSANGYPVTIRSRNRRPTCRQ